MKQVSDDSLENLTILMQMHMRIKWIKKLETLKMF